MLKWKTYKFGTISNNEEKLTDLFLPVDIPLADGQLLKAGFYNLAAGDKTPSIAIGYEET